MRVTVIGGTGRIGKRVVAQLVKDGHVVRAANRRPKRAEELLGALDVEHVMVDASDSATVEQAVDGADAVLVTIAPTREMPSDFVTQHANVIVAARQAETARLVAVTNHVALLAPDGRPMLEAQPSNPYFRELEETFVDQVHLYREVADLDWLLVAPPAELFPYGEITRTYSVGTDRLVVTDATNTHFKEVSALSMEDFAALLTDELVAPRHSRELLTAAYRDRR